MARNRSRGGTPEGLRSLINDLPSDPPPAEGVSRSDIGPGPDPGQPAPDARAAPAPTAPATSAPPSVPGLDHLVPGAPAGGPTAPTGGMSDGIPSQGITPGPSAGALGGPATPPAAAPTPAAAPDAMAEMQHRLALAERELAFFRARATAPTEAPAAAPRPAPTAPAAIPSLEQTDITDANVLPFTVRPQDVETITDEPERGALMLEQAFRQFGLHLAQLILQRVVAFYQVAETTRASRQAEQEQAQLQAAFWSQNPDLQPHAAFLQGFIAQAWHEGIRAPENLLAEAARRTRAYLQLPAASGTPTAMPAAGAAGTAGGPAPWAPISLSGAAPAPSAAAMRPAVAETTSTGGAPNGAAGLTSFERTLLQLAQR